MDKSIIRKKYIDIRNNVLDKKEKEGIIFNEIINDSDFIKSDVVAVYCSFKSEVSTKRIIDYCFYINKKVCVPKVFGDNMKFFIINSISDINYINKYGIYEPLQDVKNEINPKDIDLFLIPGICFDTMGGRIGFGKGYYDRYLTGLDAIKIGICFDEQVLNKGSIPREIHDIKMDRIITDKRIIKTT